MIQQTCLDQVQTLDKNIIKTYVSKELKEEHLKADSRYLCQQHLRRCYVRSGVLYMSIFEADVKYYDSCTNCNVYNTVCLLGKRFASTDISLKLTCL